MATRMIKFPVLMIANSKTKFEKILNAHSYNFMVGHRQTDNDDRVNAKVEASLNLRFAESGTKKKKL